MKVPKTQLYNMAKLFKSAKEKNKSSFSECGFWGALRKISRYSSIEKSIKKKIYTLITVWEEIVLT